MLRFNLNYNMLIFYREFSYTCYRSQKIGKRTFFEHFYLSVMLTNSAKLLMNGIIKVATSTNVESKSKFVLKRLAKILMI